MSSSPKFAQLHVQEIKRLRSTKASATTILVYTCLTAFDFSKRGTVYPSIRTLSEMSDIGERTIYAALRWLKIHNFIQVNHRSSKSRFVCLVRKALDWSFTKTKKTKHAGSNTSRQPKHVGSNTGRRLRNRRDYFSQNRDRSGEISENHRKKPQEPQSNCPNGVKKAHWIWMSAVHFSQNVKMMRKHPSFTNVPKDITREIITKHISNADAKNEAISMLI